MTDGLIAEVAAHRTRSVQLLELFRQRGVDLAERRAITAFFTAPDEARGSALASRLLREGFSEIRSASTATLMERSGVDYPNGEAPGSWSVQAVTTTSLEQVATDEVTKALCTLASQHAATYDSWGM